MNASRRLLAVVALGLLGWLATACSPDDSGSENAGGSSAGGSAGQVAVGGSGGSAVGGTGGSVGGSGGTGGSVGGSGGAYVECTTKCVPTPSAGWRLGYLVDGSLVDSVAGCGDGFDLPRLVHEKLDQKKRSCHCSCDAPKGGSCTGGGAKLYADDQCGGDSFEVQDGECIQSGSQLPVSGIHPQSFEGTPAMPQTPGSCEAIVEPDELIPEWLGTFTVCRANSLPPPGEKCGDDDDAICIPRGPVMVGKVCAFVEGDVACPDGYDERTVLYSGYDDKRTCSSCECRSAANQRCEGSVMLFRQQGCREVDEISDASVGASAGGTCDSLSYAGYERVYSIGFVAGEPTGGSCSPRTDTVSMEGKVELTQPMTVCCVQDDD